MDWDLPNDLRNVTILVIVYVCACIMYVLVHARICV